MIVNKKRNKKRTCLIADFAVPADHKENEKRDKYLNKDTMEHEGYGDTTCNWCTWNDSQRLSKRARGIENRRMSGEHSNYSVAKISQNTEKNPEDLKLAVTQTPVKDHQLTLVWKLTRNIILMKNNTKTHKKKDKGNKKSIPSHKRKTK